MSQFLNHCAWAGALSFLMLMNPALLCLYMILVLVTLCFIGWVLHFHLNVLKIMLVIMAWFFVFFIYVFFSDPTFNVGS